VELSQKQCKRIAPLLPKQRGHVKIENQVLLNALISSCENGCTWRALPKTFGPWYTISMRLTRWAKNGVLKRVFIAVWAEELTGMKMFSLDSTAIKVHPDAHGAMKKTADRG
jgi:transposase